MFFAWYVLILFDIATLDILRFISAVGAVNLDMKCLGFSFLVYHELKCGPQQFMAQQPGAMGGFCVRHCLSWYPNYCGGQFFC